MLTSAAVVFEAQRIRVWAGWGRRFLTNSPVCGTSKFSPTGVLIADAVQLHRHIKISTLPPPSAAQHVAAQLQKNVQFFRALSRMSEKVLGLEGQGDWNSCWFLEVFHISLNAPFADRVGEPFQTTSKVFLSPLVLKQSPLSSSKMRNFFRMLHNN